MDCELFDKLVIDRVFSELDDLTSGAVQRHVAHCSRCRSIESSLRATREVATLPLLEPSSSFAEQVLALERTTRTQLPWRQRLERTVSVLAGYAMRPQLGMSVLLLLMIGLSLLLLRTQPGERELVHVTERGVPEGEVEPRGENTSHQAAASDSALPLDRAVAGTKPESNTPIETAASSTLLDQARRAFDEGRFADAQELAEQAIRKGGPDTGASAMLSAQALLRTSGCPSAIARFEALRARHGKSSLGEEAAFHAAECHLETGHVERATSLYRQLQGNPTWGERARERLQRHSLSTDSSAAVENGGGSLPSTP